MGRWLLQRRRVASDTRLAGYFGQLRRVVHHVSRVIPEAYLATRAARVNVPGFLGYQGQVDLIGLVGGGGRIRTDEQWICRPCP